MAAKDILKEKVNTINTLIGEARRFANLHGIHIDAEPVYIDGDEWQDSGCYYGDEDWLASGVSC